MEIFQTIWTALITENEALINILFIPLTFIEVAAFIILSNTLLNLKLSKKNLIIYILSVSLISTITSLVLNNTFRVIINIVFIPLFAVFALKLSLFKGLLIEFLPLIIMRVTETIWFNFINIFFNITSEQLITIPIYKIIILSLDYISLFIIYNLSKKYDFNITLLDNLPKGT